MKSDPGTMEALLLSGIILDMFTVENLTKKYGNTTAVSSLSFSAPDGAVTGFLGPNGAGKSTTMRCMLGLDSADTGTMLIDDRPLHAHLKPAAIVGAVLDAGWYHPGRTARAHLQITAASGNIPLSRVDDVLDTVGLTPAAHRRISGFSLGMKQRLGLASALLGDPKNLILDEPVNGLDPEGVHWMRQVVRQAADAGKAVLVSSHLLSEMQMIADRLVVIGRGTLIGEYSMTEFLAQGTTTVLVHTDDDSALQQRLGALGAEVLVRPDCLAITVNTDIPDTIAVSRICREMDLLIHSLAQSNPTLEENFLSLTESAAVYRADI